MFLHDYIFDSATRQLHQLEEERKKIMQQLQQKDLKINGRINASTLILQIRNPFQMNSLGNDDAN